MDIVICDLCYKLESRLVEAIDIMPEVQLILSKRRIAPRGYCDTHLASHFPEELDARPARGRPPGRDPAAIPPMPSSRVGRDQLQSFHEIPSDLIDATGASELLGIVSAVQVSAIVRKAGLKPQALLEPNGAYLWKRVEIEELAKKRPGIAPRPEAELISGAEAMKIIGCSLHTLTRLVKAKKLIPTKRSGRGGPYLYDKAQVEACAVNRTTMGRPPKPKREPPAQLGGVDLLTTEQAAEMLGVTTKAINWYVNKGGNLKPAVRGPMHAKKVEQKGHLFKRSDVERLQQDRVQRKGGESLPRAPEE